MSQIVLCTINSKYQHTAFGLRYLLANLGQFKDITRLFETQLSSRPIDIVEEILSSKPKIVGLGVYIWNVRESFEVVSLIKRLAPEVIVVLGGPEVSFETEEQPITDLADYVITGEGETSFRTLVELILKGTAATERIIQGVSPDLTALSLPYVYYSPEDIAHRVIYVESSRGCPFRCAFCLSALDKSVRSFPAEAFFEALDDLIKKGARHFKFVDRTFNLNLKHSKQVLTFFKSRLLPGMFLHFEVIPDRFPLELQQIVEEFPKGALQFEIGVQTFNPEVCRLISRHQDNQKVEETFRWIIEKTNVYVHSDLIWGLPGEDLQSIKAGFNRLLALSPHEIQLGILKRLRGTPITALTADYQMVYSPLAPYELLQNSVLDFHTMQRLKRFARYFDLYYNSGRFKHLLPQLWNAVVKALPNAESETPFDLFLSFSDWLFTRLKRTAAITPQTLELELFHYLRDMGGIAGVETKLCFQKPNFHSVSIESPSFRANRRQRRHRERQQVFEP